MRVIAGRFRGRPLSAPVGDATRPITDRVKESIFNIIGARLGTLSELPDVDVLDLFAGSGSFGIEALSRGARSCLFVERNRAALLALRANVEKLDLPREAARIAAENAWKIRPAAPNADGFGLIFVDPPYRDVDDPLRVSDLLETVGAALAADGLLLFRHSIETGFDAGGLPGLAIGDERTMGSMRVWFLTRK
jgi:16S rRNA (guanine966-N2)-methyltransferase